MPTRVLLEGPAIEPLLAQVREEYGSGVRIISADKVRSGGFGGFFAKQHYELSVEVPDQSNDRKNMAQRKTPTAPPPREEAAHTLEQLLERAESNDRIVPDEPSPFQRPPLADRVSAFEPPRAEKPPVVEKQQPAEAPQVEQLFGRSAGIEDAEEAGTGGRPMPDIPAGFAELLAGLEAANHIPTAPPGRPSPRPKANGDDSPTVRPFRPATATGSAVNSATGALRPLPPVPSLAELMGGLGVTEPETPAAEPAKPAPAAPSAARSAAAIYGLNAPVSPAAPVPSETNAVARIEEASPPILHALHNDPVVTNLIAVGMPEPMAAQITGGDTYAGVLTALASRPSAPGVPDGAGEILVMAGDVAHAVPIAKELLTQAGIDQAHLLLAGPSAAGTGLHSSRVLANAKTAAARAEKLQGSDGAWIVVLDAPVGRTDPIWVSDMCDAIGATAVWAVVDATRKTADTARHLRTLGEVEALVVHGVELTSDPATVLGLALPIYSRYGKPATPHAWAAMLCARIAADVTPQAAAPRRQVRSAR